MARETGLYEKKIRREKQIRLLTAAVTIVILATLLALWLFSKNNGSENETIVVIDEPPKETQPAEVKPIEEPKPEPVPLIAKPAPKPKVEPTPPPEPIPAQPEKEEPKVPAVETKPAAPAKIEPIVNEIPEEFKESQSLVDNAFALLKSQPTKIVEARDMLNRALMLPISSQNQAIVKRKLAELSNFWLFSSSIFSNDRLCGRYTVKSGDNLTDIGNRFKVPYEILMQINNIHHANALQAGQTLKVINGPFHAKVYKSNFTLDLYLQNTYVKTFRVGIGRPGNETPSGLWMVKLGGKLISPTWTDPDTGKVYKSSDPDYPLGSRWIALDGVKGDAKGRTGFAIHGTKKPDEIGVAASRGCIRMYNGEVILMYNLMMPGESQVMVVD